MDASKLDEIDRQQIAAEDLSIAPAFAQPQQAAQEEWGWVPPDWKLTGGSGTDRADPMQARQQSGQPQLGNVPAAAPPQAPALGAQPFAPPLPMGPAAGADHFLAAMAPPAPAPTEGVVGQYGRPIGPALPPPPAPPPEPWQAADPEVNTELGALSGLSDEDLAARHAELEAQRREQVAFKERQIRRESQWEAEAEAARLEKANNIAIKQLAEMDTESKALAKTPINNDRWWSSRDTGQKVAGFMSAIIGGLLAPHHGGRNDAIDFIMKQIDQDIQSQVGDLQNRRGALAERRGIVAQAMETSRDLYRAKETARMAALEQIDKELGAEAQKFNPEGTVAMSIELARRQVRAERAAQQSKTRQQLFENTHKMLEYQEKHRSNVADEKNARRQVGLGYAGLKQQAAEFDFKRKLETGKFNLDVDKAMFEREKERLKLEAQRRGDPLAVLSPEKYFNQVAPTLLNKDGSHFVYKSEKQAHEGMKMEGAVREVVALIDDITELRHRVGSETTLVNSKEYQDMASRGNKLWLKLKNTEGLGVLAGPDMDILSAMTGDPNQFRDQLGKLISLRETTLRGYNNELAPQGYSGNFDIPKPEERREAATNRFGDAVLHVGSDDPNAVLEGLDVLPNLLEDNTSLINTPEATDALTKAEATLRAAGLNDQQVRERMAPALKAVTKARGVEKSVLEAQQRERAAAGTLTSDEPLENALDIARDSPF